MNIDKQRFEKALAEKIAGRETVVWGTGVIAEAVYDYISRLAHISFFVSMDAERNRFFDGKPVYTKDEIQLSPAKNFIIVLTNRTYQDIRDDIRGMGFVPNEDFLGIADFYKECHTYIKYPVAYADSVFDFTASSGDGGGMERRFNIIGRNTGNLVHYHALKNSIKADNIPIADDSELYYAYKTAVSGLLYITEGISGDVTNLFDIFPNASVVPISAGVASENRKPSEFNMPENIKGCLKGCLNAAD